MAMASQTSSRGRRADKSFHHLDLLSGAERGDRWHEIRARLETFWLRLACCFEACDQTAHLPLTRQRRPLSQLSLVAGAATAFVTTQQPLELRGGPAPSRSRHTHVHPVNTCLRDSIVETAAALARFLMPSMRAYSGWVT